MLLINFLAFSYLEVTHSKVFGSDTAKYGKGLLAAGGNFDIHSLNNGSCLSNVRSQERVTDGLRILRGQRTDITRIVLIIPRNNEQQVGPDAADRPGDRILSALADGQHGDHSAHADDDPEDRQARTHFVSVQAFQRLDQYLYKTHVVSVSTTPSRMRIVRWVCAATFGSCVTMIKVVPLSRLSFKSKSMISWPTFESRFPVGSSAMMMAGLFLRPGSIATRRRWPPESS